MYKEGDGIEHTIASEEGFVLPGEIAVATDSHTCTQGALGALAFGIGTTEAENLLATGELYSFTVPETVRFHGRREPAARRLSQGPRAPRPRPHGRGWLLQDASPNTRAPPSTSMEMDGRFTVCNLSVEMSARTAIVNPDQTTMAYVDNALSGKGRALTARAGGHGHAGATPTRPTPRLSTSTPPPSNRPSRCRIPPPTRNQSARSTTPSTSSSSAPARTPAGAT